MACDRLRPIAGWLFLGLTVTALPSCSRKDQAMGFNERRAEQALIDGILDAADESSRGEALRRHGPVRPDELAHIARRSQDPSPKVQRNAIWLLKTARDPGAVKILRQRLADTTDPIVFAQAFEGLLLEPDAKALAGSRKELLSVALTSTDPKVHAAALRAAVWGGGFDGPALLRAALSHAQPIVRETAVELIAQPGNAAAYEPQLRALLREKERLPLSDYTALYGILAQSAESDTAHVIRHSLKTPRAHELIDFSNAVFFSKSRQPWLRDLLFDLLAESGEAAEVAFSRLAGFGQDAGWGPAVHPALVKRCLNRMEQAPAEGNPSRHRALVDLEPCREFLGRLAGRQAFSPDEAAAAMDFARRFLKTAAPH